VTPPPGESETGEEGQTDGADAAMVIAGMPSVVTPSVAVVSQGGIFQPVTVYTGLAEGITTASVPVWPLLHVTELAPAAERVACLPEHTDDGCARSVIAGGDVTVITAGTKGDWHNALSIVAEADAKKATVEEALTVKTFPVARSVAGPGALYQPIVEPAKPAALTVAGAGLVHTTVPVAVIVGCTTSTDSCAPAVQPPGPEAVTEYVEVTEGDTAILGLVDPPVHVKFVALVETLSTADAPRQIRLDESAAEKLISVTDTDIALHGEAHPFDTARHS
jgi:hypothetical protein